MGDILGLLIETFYASGDREKATHFLNQLQVHLPNVGLDYYVDSQIIADLRGDTTSEDGHISVGNGIEEKIRGASRLSEYDGGHRRQASHASGRSVTSHEEGF